MRQAEFACNDSPDPGVRFCKDLALPFILQTVRGKPSIQDMLHPAIGIIETYDADHDTHLMETLKAYIAARYNQVEAAGRLHVHLNTFKYRIKRIQEITALDYQNQTDMLYLQLSFELRC